MRDPKDELIEDIKRLEELRDRRKRNNVPRIPGLSKEISFLRWKLRYCFSKGEKKMKKTNITMRIPGGLYGNDPGFLTINPKCGNVTIDAEHTVAAVEWLKRRGMIMNIKPSSNDPKDIFISYILR